MCWGIQFPPHPPQYTHTHIHKHTRAHTIFLTTSPPLPTPFFKSRLHHPFFVDAPIPPQRLKFWKYYCEEYGKEIHLNHRKASPPSPTPTHTHHFLNDLAPPPQKTHISHPSSLTFHDPSQPQPLPSDCETTFSHMCLIGPPPPPCKGATIPPPPTSISTTNLSLARN